MKLHPNHAVAAATVFVIAALVQLSGNPEAASAPQSDPSLPSAAAALAGSNAASGNVQDLTY
jgi:hypothetical protein